MNKEGKAYIGDEIVEGNRLIAEFDGWVEEDGLMCKQEGSTCWRIDLEDFKYHSSWDWLKPVIDEIFTYAIAHHEQVKVIRDISIVVEIGACWQKVVEFITWYNQNKQS